MLLSILWDRCMRVVHFSFQLHFYVCQLHANIIVWRAKLGSFLHRCTHMITRAGWLACATACVCVHLLTNIFLLGKYKMKIFTLVVMIIYGNYQTFVHVPSFFYFTNDFFHSVQTNVNWALFLLPFWDGSRTRLFSQICASHMHASLHHLREIIFMAIYIYNSNTHFTTRPRARYTHRMRDVRMKELPQYGREGETEKQQHTEQGAFFKCFMLYSMRKVSLLPSFDKTSSPSTSDTPVRMK